MLFLTSFTQQVACVHVCLGFIKWEGESLVPMSLTTRLWLSLMLQVFLCPNFRVLFLIVPLLQSNFSSLGWVLVSLEQNPAAALGWWSDHSAVWWALKGRFAPWRSAESLLTGILLLLTLSACVWMQRITGREGCWRLTYGFGCVLLCPGSWDQTCNISGVLVSFSIQRASLE